VAGRKELDLTRESQLAMGETVRREALQGEWVGMSRRVCRGGA
jgi:hypothetical protein